MDLVNYGAEVKFKTKVVELFELDTSMMHIKNRANPSHHMSMDRVRESSATFSVMLTKCELFFHMPSKIFSPYCPSRLLRINNWLVKIVVVIVGVYTQRLFFIDICRS